MAKEFKVRVYFESSALYSITAETEHEAREKAVEEFNEEIIELDIYIATTYTEIEEG